MNLALAFVAGVLLALVAAWLYRRLRVPPPAFTGASFANDAPGVTVRADQVKLFYWTAAAAATFPPQNPADYGTWADAVMVTLDARGVNHWWTFLGVTDVVGVAFVVTVDGVTSPFIKILPAAALDASMAIGHAHAATRPGNDGIELYVWCSYGSSNYADLLLEG